MKAYIGLFAVVLGLCVTQMAHATLAHEPGSLEQGFGFTLTFNNLDQTYNLPSTVWSGDVDLLAPDTSVFEVLRFIPESGNASIANTAIVYSNDHLPSPALSNSININADFVDGVTTYVACHCDVYNIPTGRENVVVTVVPLPAASAMGGLGLGAVILGGWLRSRRLARA